MQTDYYITAPYADLLTLAETKEWLRIDADVTEDDTLITALIETAVNYCEKYVNRVFTGRSVSAYFANLTQETGCDPFLQIRRDPVSSITDVWGYAGGDYVVLDPEDYEMQRRSAFNRVFFRKTLILDKVAYPIKIDFQAGYGDPAAVPEAIKTAVKQMILFLYENRGDVAPEGKIGMPLETKAILGKYRILNTF